MPCPPLLLFTVSATASTLFTFFCAFCLWPAEACRKSRKTDLFKTTEASGEAWSPEARSSPQDREGWKHNSSKDTCTLSVLPQLPTRPQFLNTPLTSPTAWDSEFSFSGRWHRTQISLRADGRPGLPWGNKDKGRAHPHLKELPVTHTRKHGIGY